MTTMKTRLRNASEAEKEKMFEDLYVEYQRKYGTDTKNMVVKYLRWIGFMPNYYGDYSGLIQGDFGYSYELKDDVINVVKQPMKNTVFINIFATILALGITIPLGIVCAVKKGSKGDQVMQVITIIGYSLPSFVTAILFVWIFCSLLGIFPPSGMKTPGSNYTGWKWFTDRMYYMALPLITMTFCSLGSMTRYVRASMIDALSLDCIRTARAKGVTEKAVIYSHAWRNALIPIVTLVVGWFLGIFGGSLMFENIFGINGMGKLMIQSLRTQDFDVVVLLQLFYVAISLIGNLIIDIVYGLVDPRVRVSA
jgi:peptide/nickel transport system permease protein